MIPIIQDYKTVILVDGLFPEHPVPLSILNKADRIICCDGATESLIRYGLEPAYIVGDMDSLSLDLKQKYAAIIHPDPDQETNDLTKAIQFCKKNAWTEVSILGATGKREDHTLGNLSLLADYAEYMSVQLLSDYGSFVPQLHTAEYESFAGQQVSIFSLNTDTVISTKNLMYPIQERKLTSWWQGTLNEALGSSFEIRMDKGKILLFREYAL